MFSLRHDPGFYRLPNAELLHDRLPRGAVDREPRVRQRQVLERSGAQHLAFAVDHARGGAPEDELTNGIGEADVIDREPVAHQSIGCFAIGRDEDFEWPPGLHLGIELSHGSEGENRLVSRILFECLGDLLHRRGEIGRDGNLNFVRRCL